MMRILGMISGVAAPAIAACATYAAAPIQQLADAEAAARTAQESGAASDPQGQLHLELALEEISQGKKLMANHDYDRATSMLTRARSDAELSLAQARTDQAQAEAQRALQALSQLQQSGPPAPASNVTTTGATVPVAPLPPPAALPPTPPPLPAPAPQNTGGKP
jgi:hypothetical protein